MHTAWMRDSEQAARVPASESRPTAPEPTAKRPNVIEDVVCSYCADLCDDLRLTVEDNRIAAVEVDCPAGRAFFAGYQVETVTPRVRGVEAGWDAAVEEAAMILAGAVSPLVVGLGATACEAQRVAVELAEAIGACIDTPYVAFYGPRALALQQVGEASCTLGEVRNRADLVIVWGGRPDRDPSPPLVALCG